MNLLDNASRYAGKREGSIQVLTSLQRGTSGRPALMVWSDGAPLEPAVQRHLFEPFGRRRSWSSTTNPTCARSTS
ncbi:Uncharacterised protein [Mycobacterium tuberculosis]|nr:Uncharacterised protein [Mycobacterium tuberculosis]